MLLLLLLLLLEKLAESELILKQIRPSEAFKTTILEKTFFTVFVAIGTTNCSWDSLYEILPFYVLISSSWLRRQMWSASMISLHQTCHHNAGWSDAGWSFCTSKIGVIHWWMKHLENGLILRGFCYLVQVMSAGSYRLLCGDSFDCRQYKSHANLNTLHSQV